MGLGVSRLNPGSVLSGSRVYPGDYMRCIVGVSEVYLVATMLTPPQIHPWLNTGYTPIHLAKGQNPAAGDVSYKNNGIPFGCAV